MSWGFPAYRPFVLAALLLVSAASHAQRADVHVPDELQDWREWVLKDREYIACPFLFNQRPNVREVHICAWPGELELTVNADGGRFEQEWAVYAGREWIPLPGDERHWPEQVTANGEPALVVLRDSAPSIRLPAGRYTVSGRFAWNAAPRELAIPRRTGLLALSVGGERIVRPEFGGSGVWLAPREPAATSADAIDVQVYRLIVDDVPTGLITVFELEISGGVREETLEPVLPAAFIPLALESELPARLEADGGLELQARPGSWEVRVEARAPGVLDAVTLPVPVRNLPEAEVWSFRGNERVRVSVPEGLPPVDPSRAAVPHEWEELPAFRVAAGETLGIVERSRGRSARDNHLRLDRRLWLDFDGGGYIFSDTVTGTMQSGWRLDMTAPYALLSASAHGEDLLVTRGPGEGLTGVELRHQDVDLEALGRRDERGEMAVSGWQAPFDGLETVLNLPPGHKLLAAAGADRAPGAWIERWQLLDFFLVLIATIAAARLFGAAVAAVAFFALVLSWHESGAAQWAWINLLVAVALVRVAPEGRLRKAAGAWRALGIAALVVILVPFVAGQLRIAIYPQLERQLAPGMASVEETDGGPAPAARAPEAMLDPVAISRSQVEEIVVTGSRATSFARYAPNAIVQAGPGRPSWSWNRYRLSWSGPVDPERTLTLVIMPRWLVSGLRFVAVLLLGALAAAFILEAMNRRWPRPGGGAGISASAGLVVAALFAGAPAAQAEAPPAELLQELQERLLEPPPCAPRCAEIARAEVEVQRDTLTVTLEVHALENVALSLPGSPDSWYPQRVQVDGRPAGEVYRSPDRVLWIRAGQGRSRVTLRGPLPSLDNLAVPFPTAPRIITASADGWLVSGIRDRRLTAGSLQLTRVRDDADHGPVRWESSRFPTFVRIERTIGLDVDWRASTRVIRVAPEEGALTLNLPLLEGESVLTDDLPVRDGLIQVSMDPTQRVLEWQSSLPRTSKLELTAGDDVPWREVWRFAVGSVWHASFRGVPESESATADGAVRIAEFHPRAGEVLTVQVARPEATRGETLAFDKVTLVTDAGARSRDVRMSLGYRSTRGSQQAIRLPAAAELLAVTVDGNNASLRADDGVLTLPILPGNHEVVIHWRRAAAIAAREETPAVDVGAAASNIELRMNLPQNRWVLATSGPVLGPAILYWPELAALLLFALVLGRIRITPLTTTQWLLLGLGFSTFSWPALALVAAWLLACGARRHWEPARDAGPGQYNAVQLGYAALTVVALATIVVSVPAGLLGTPDMHVTGHGSYGNALRWFADASADLLPRAAVYTLPMWMYKVLILAWALWLSFALLRWLPWVWQGFVRHGLWRPRKEGAAPAAS